MSNASAAKGSEGSGGRWIPLESNPDFDNIVWIQWAKKAGLVTSQARFVDVYGLDEELLGLVPRPVKAVVLLFPIDSKGEVKRNTEDDRIAKDGQPKIDNTIFWVKQTISNACGTIGLIHSLANSAVTFTPTSPLQKYILECHDKTPLERAKTLETTPLFANIHAEAASDQTVNQTAVQEDTELHFTCFVEAPEQEFRKIAKQGGTADTGMRLIELDGRRNGPIDHGECKDLLKDAANIVKSRYVTGSSSVLFSMMALTTAPEGSY
ncbi:hypothetical protein B0H34DRAFT_663742 [Crassisporium funariophilum]|nr:hypothetical protein B0H34DRAFT_663742 [Crassisporium funariophilum]